MTISPIYSMISHKKVKNQLVKYIIKKLSKYILESTKLNGYGYPDETSGNSSQGPPHSRFLSFKKSQTFEPLSHQISAN